MGYSAARKAEQEGMSLHNGVDLVSISTSGVYTATYGSGQPANRANLYVSRGFFEDAPDIAAAIGNLLKIIGGGFKKLIG